MIRMTVSESSSHLRIKSEWRRTHIPSQSSLGLGLTVKQLVISETCELTVLELMVANSKLLFSSSPISLSCQLQQAGL